MHDICFISTMNLQVSASSLGKMQLGTRSFVTNSRASTKNRRAKANWRMRAAPVEKQQTLSSAPPAGHAGITFNILYRAMFGQQLYVTGGCEVLGSWDPANALVMEWTDGDLWTTTCHLPSGQTIDYKYIIKTENCNHVVWQSCSNMIIEVPAAASALCIHDSWDGCEHNVNPVVSSSTISDEGPVDILVTGSGIAESAALQNSAVPLPATANTDAIANSLLAKAMEEELAKTSIENLPLEDLKEMLKKHGLPSKGKKEQMVDRLKQEMSKNGVATSKA